MFYPVLVPYFLGTIVIENVSNEAFVFLKIRLQQNFVNK